MGNREQLGELAQVLGGGRQEEFVSCDGFFEFTGEKGAKQPYLFRPKDRGAMTIAGLWEQWHGPKDASLPEPLLSVSIATCAPNATALRFSAGKR